MDDDQNMMDEEVDKSLHIKGQMNFMPDWNVVMFLCSPAIANLEQLQVRAKPYQSPDHHHDLHLDHLDHHDDGDHDQTQAAGLFICDLSMHDFSRDLLLASRSFSLDILALRHYNVSRYKVKVSRPQGHSVLIFSF